MTDLAAKVLTAAPGDVYTADEIVQAADFGPESAAHSPEGDGIDQGEAVPLDLISEEVWLGQWGDLHDLVGGMIQGDDPRPLPLGDKARSPGGEAAGKAAYSLFASTPFLAKLVLSPASSLWGGVMVMGLHGLSCVQMVKQYRAQPYVQGEGAQ